MSELSEANFHKEICEAAHRHYEYMSGIAHMWHSTIPTAIEYYSIRDQHIDKRRIKKVIEQRDLLKGIDTDTQKEILKELGL